MRKKKLNMEIEKKKKSERLRAGQIFFLVGVLFFWIVVLNFLLVFKMDSKIYDFGNIVFSLFDPIYLNFYKLFKINVRLFWTI